MNRREGGARLPVLVDCEPYNARITKQKCVERFAKAKTIVVSGKGIPAGPKAFRNNERRSALSHCIGCDIGAQRELENGIDR